MSTSASVAHPCPLESSLEVRKSALWKEEMQQANEVALAGEAAATSASNKPFDQSSDMHKRPSLKEILQLPPDASYASNSSSPETRPLVVGHRGWLYEHLENTIAGFQACADLGCYAVELDVFRLDDDGSLIVFHGAGSDESGGSLEHYIYDTESFDHTNTIRELSWEQIENCQFRSNSPQLPCPEDAIQEGRIPKFEEVLKMAKETGLHLKIELKGPNTVEPTIQMVEDYDMVDQCSFSSFRPDHVALVSELDRENREDSSSHRYERGLLFKGEVPDNFIEKASNVGATQVHLRYDTCTPQRVQQIHQAGLVSMAWFRGPVAMSQQKYCDVGDEHDEELYKTVLATGVKQICVNRPNVVLGILDGDRSKKE